MRSASRVVSGPGAVPTCARSACPSSSATRSAAARSPPSARERIATRAAGSDAGSNVRARSATPVASGASPRASSHSAYRTSASSAWLRQRTRSTPSQLSNSFAPGTARPSKKSPSTKAAAACQSPRPHDSTNRSQSSVTASAPSRIWSTSACTCSSPRMRRNRRSASLSEWRAWRSSLSLHSEPTRCSRVRLRRGLRAR